MDAVSVPICHGAFRSGGLRQLGKPIGDCGLKIQLNYYVYINLGEIAELCL